MDIQRAGARPSVQGPEDWFTGTVRIDPLFDAKAPARAAGAAVTFEPGARTAWHTHPLGQTLIVTAGLGLVQREGGPIEEIRPGDVVSFEPGEKHWHGASPTTAMTHIAVHEAQDGKAVEWMEHVSDEQYRASPGGSGFVTRQEMGMSDQAKANRPRVICHMVGSVDGRIVTEGWPLPEEGNRQYEQVHASYEPQGWICGRVTMEQHFAAGTRSDTEVAREYEGASREDFVAPGEHESFAIALDPRGKLLWDSGELHGDHVVAVLTHRVSGEYLAFLRERGVSYLLAGDEEIDLPLALEKIRSWLGIRTLMLEGGGGINGSFLRAGLVDELSLLLAPVADGRIGTPALFDVEGDDVMPHRLVLESVERRADDVMWLRYRVGNERPVQSARDGE